MDAIQEIYLSYDEIVLEKMSGVFPLLYKDKKKEIDPCCQLFNRFIYYKNSLEGKLYVKQLRIKNLEDKEKHTNDLSMLPLIEEDNFNFPNGYLKSKEQIEELKLKNN